MRWTNYLPEINMPSARQTNGYNLIPPDLKQTDERGASMKCDVIVVGAGLAGCSTSLRQKRNPSVLLLEAGPDYPDFDLLTDDLKYGETRDAEAEGAPHNWAMRGTINEMQGEIHVAEGKVGGGSGAINGQVFLRRRESPASIRKASVSSLHIP